MQVRSAPHVREPYATLAGAAGLTCESPVLPCVSVGAPCSPLSVSSAPTVCSSPLAISSCSQSPQRSRHQLAWAPALVNRIIARNVGPNIHGLQRCAVTVMMDPLKRQFFKIRRDLIIELREQSPCDFFVGVSTGVLHRYSNVSYGYQRLGYTRMVALTLCRALEAAAHEQELISFCEGQWRRNNIPRATLQNQRSGGDGFSVTSASPYFVYVTTKPSG